jgi:hypothetical protein
MLFDLVERQEEEEKTLECDVRSTEVEEKLLLPYLQLLSIEEEML